MKHLAATLLAMTFLTAACGGGGAGDPADPTDGTPVKIKRVVVSFTATDATSIGSPTKRANVYLQLTDERGHTTSHSLGVFDGVCTPAAPGSPTLLAAMRCWTGERGADLAASSQRNQISITRLWLEAGVTPDPFAIQEISRYTVELGTKIDPAPM